MSHEDGGSRLPTVVARGGEVLAPEDTPGYLAETRHDEGASRLRNAIAIAAGRFLDETNTYSPRQGQRAPDKHGYAALATRFQLETWSEPPEITWERNVVYEEAVREGWERKARERGVAPVFEHCRAVVEAHGVAPWGAKVSRRRVCSTRGKHFYYQSSGDYNLDKYRDGAEHICAAIAETRAIGAVTDALLALGLEADAQEGQGRDLEAERKKAEKRERQRREELQQEWRDTLERHEVSADAESAFYMAHPHLPDDPSRFEAAHYETCVNAVARHGASLFDRAVKKLNGEDPLAEDEQPATDRDPAAEQFDRGLDDARAQHGVDPKFDDPPPPDDEPPPPSPAERKNRVLMACVRIGESHDAEDPTGWLNSQLPFLLDDVDEDTSISKLDVEQLEQFREKLIAQAEGEDDD